MNYCFTLDFTKLFFDSDSAIMRDEPSGTIIAKLDGKVSVFNSAGKLAIVNKADVIVTGNDFIPSGSYLVEFEDRNENKIRASISKSIFRQVVVEPENFFGYGTPVIINHDFNGVGDESLAYQKGHIVGMTKDYICTPERDGTFYLVHLNGDDKNILRVVYWADVDPIQEEKKIDFCDCERFYY